MAAFAATVVVSWSIAAILVFHLLPEGSAPTVAIDFNE